jgi:hypothetical protein
VVIVTSDADAFDLSSKSTSTGRDNLREGRNAAKADADDLFKMSRYPDPRVDRGLGNDSCEVVHAPYGSERVKTERGSRAAVAFG